VGPTNYNVLDARYSAAVNKIVFIGAPVGSTNANRVFTMSTDGSNLAEAVTADGASLIAESATWSTDGQSIVWSGKTPTDATQRVYQYNLASKTLTPLVDLKQGSTYVYRPFVYRGLLDDPAHLTTITAADVSGQYSDTVSLKATLANAADNSPLPGQTVRFRVDGVDVAQTGVTDAAGVAAVPYVLNDPGTHTIEAIFDGAGMYGPSDTAPSHNKTLTINPESATIVWNGDTSTSGAAFNLSARLVQDPDSEPGTFTHGEQLKFTVTPASGAPVTYTADVELTAPPPFRRRRRWQRASTTCPSSCWGAATSRHRRFRSTFRRRPIWLLQQASAACTATRSR
jgi:hypothetical protein